MKFYRILKGLLPLTLAAVACGSSDDDDESGSSVPIEELPAAYAGQRAEVKGASHG